LAAAGSVIGLGALLIAVFVLLKMKRDVLLAEMSAGVYKWKPFLCLMAFAFALFGADRNYYCLFGRAGCYLT
jgi:hypothetical protein